MSMEGTPSLAFGRRTTSAQLNNPTKAKLIVRSETAHPASRQAPRRLQDGGKAAPVRRKIDRRERAMTANRQILLDQIPQGKLAPEHFRLAEAQAPTPAEGQVLLRTRYISLDAANRAWMQGATYRSALSAGQVMAGGSLAEVVESRAPGLAPGDLVFADTGWQDYAVLPGKHLSKL